MPPSALAQRLIELLALAQPPVAVSIHEGGSADVTSARRPDKEPAGCCFWAQGERQAILTAAAGHSHCSVGSYTHGFTSLTAAAAGADTAALVGSDWVTEADLAAAPAIPCRPAAVSYAPLDEADHADVVLMRMTPASLMALQGAVPEVTLVGKRARGQSRRERRVRGQPRAHRHGGGRADVRDPRCSPTTDHRAPGTLAQS